MKKFYLLKNFQVIYGIVLVLLVPTVIVVNTVVLNSAFKTNIDIQLQRQALSLGRSFNISLKDSLGDLEVVQTIIDNTINTQVDVKNIRVLEFRGEDFLVIASSNREQVGDVNSETQNFLAWHRNEAIATLVSGLKLGLDGRFWLVTMPLKDNAGRKSHLLTMSVSLEVMDALVRTTLLRSYIVLTLTVLFLILLLAANSRLFEYALLYRKIKEVDKMKDEFISIASHELRTPLTVIKGYISMLLKDEKKTLSQSTRDTLHIIDSSAVRLNSLVEDLLNVSRIEQNRLQLDIVMVDALEMISQAIGELKVEAETKGLNLKMACRDKIPQVFADQNKLKQVLINIIGNAIKYTKQGSITVECNVKGQYLQIVTTDTGIGMSAKDREHLFEKFYRVKKEETQDITGTGLGLWITKQLILKMSGEIQVDSIEGIGTQVSILLPLKK